MAGPISPLPHTCSQPETAGEAGGAGRDWGGDSQCRAAPETCGTALSLDRGADLCRRSTAAAAHSSRTEIPSTGTGLAGAWHAATLPGGGAARAHKWAFLGAAAGSLAT